MFESFAAVVADYSVIFFDAYGVLKNSAGVLAETPRVLAGLRAQGKQLFVLTNDASRPPTNMAHGYVDQKHGQLITTDQLVSSGLLATEFLRDKVRTGTVAYLGPSSAAYFIEAAGLQAQSVAEVVAQGTEISAIALLDDEGFDWFQDLNRTLNLARQYNVPLLVANSDLAYPVGTDDQLGIAIGSLANMLEAVIGKTFIRCGKPDPMMFNYAYELARQVDPALDKQGVVMVGDSLNTDILGANRFGIDTVLVTSGTTRPSSAPALIEASGIIPTHICASIFT